MIHKASFILFKLMLLLGGAWLLQSCGSGSSFSRPNVNYLYDFRSLAPRPHYVVYHKNADTSRIFYRLSSEELLYVRQANTNNYKADFTIKYKLIDSFENPLVLDTAEFKLGDVEEKPNGKVVFGYFDVAPFNGFGRKHYILDITIVDNNRNLSFNNFLCLDRNSTHSAQNYLLTDTIGNPLFKNHLPSNIPFRIDCRQNSPVLYVSYYKRNFPLALPPYSSPNKTTFELAPDTTFLVRADTILYLAAEGFYHFRKDTTQWAGFTLYNFYPQFPYVATHAQMVGPMRYITTKREYNGLLEAGGEKARLREEINTFWLERSGSMERSKILLGSFFNRVQEANLLFSSYIEGWKTDRGIMYIVYGPPDKVYRFNESEAWIYGDETSSLSYYFTFSKLNNPFTDNDYQLSRSSSYRYGWGQAIEAWRNGKVYTSKDIQQEQNESDQRIRAQQRAPYWY